MECASSKYLLIMELRFDAMVCSNLGNKSFDANHNKCSRGSQVPQLCSKTSKTSDTEKTGDLALYPFNELRLTKVSMMKDCAQGRRNADVLRGYCLPCPLKRGGGCPYIIVS